LEAKQTKGGLSPHYYDERQADHLLKPGDVWELEGIGVWLTPLPKRK